MNKEYEIYYEAFDIKDADERRNFILEKCAGDKTLFDNIMRLFPDEEIFDDDVYGKYIIEKLIGSGGMGIVYLASFSEDFGNEIFTKQVALKTINPELKLESKSIKIFLKEIKTQAELEHPNIARFLDIGTSEKGKPFFVMEYVDGVSVTEHCNKSKLSISERIEFFRQILNAIEYSHSRGFIHCDIKPNNIIVDTKGTPKVIDFGIASKYGSFVSEKNQTTFFQNAFTPNYASPEQIKGEKNLTETTDIYSLGVVLYELLTGQLPLELNSSDSYPHLISSLEKNVPPTLRKSVTKVMDEAERERLFLERDCQTIYELKENLSNHLDEIVKKAINKKSSKRYANVKEFDSEIAEYLNEDSFFKQIKSAFSILYKKTLRKIRRVSPKLAIASFLGMIVLIGILSQSLTFRTIPYYLQLKLSDDTNQIDLSDSQKTAIKSSINELKELISVDFNKAVGELENENPTVKTNVWSLTNFIVGLSSADYPLDQTRLNSVLDKTQTEDGCWKEEKFACKMIISGWVMLAKKNLNKPLSEQQLEFVLKNQSSEGWFPAYPYPDDAKNAATYPTAIIVLGLIEQLQQNLIDKNYEERVKFAINEGVTWLLKTRNRNGEFLWSDCPKVDLIWQTPSYGVDGTIIYTLHFVAKSGLVQTPNLTNELKEIDSIWLDKLDQTPNFPLEHQIDGRCFTVSADGGIMDRTIRFSMPWLILATIEAYPNGTVWQKAIATKRLENIPFSQKYKGYTFGASEYIISLTELQKSYQK